MPAIAAVLIIAARLRVTFIPKCRPCTTCFERRWRETLNCPPQQEQHEHADDREEEIGEGVTAEVRQGAT